MEIVWSARAIRSLGKIRSDIKDRFSVREEKQFIQEVIQTIKSIKEFPKGFPECIKPKNARRAVVHPNTTLCYRVKSKKRLGLLLFWENRKNPEKNQIIILPNFPAIFR